MNSVVVVGNPKPLSRTRSAAELVVHRLTGSAPAAVIEVAALGPGLLGWGDPGVAAAKVTVKQADLLVFASPTFKATYTGLLKLFLDQFAAGELHPIPAVALMLGAGPLHALAPEVHLKPLLVEIGCVCSTPGLYLLDSNWAESDLLDAWLARASAVLAPA